MASRELACSHAGGEKTRAEEQTAELTSGGACCVPSRPSPQLRRKRRAALAPRMAARSESEMGSARIDSNIDGMLPI